MTFILTPELSAYMFVSELRRLTIGNVQVQALRFAVVAGGETVFANSYTPDAAGTVTVHDLDLLLEPLLDAGQADVTFEIGAVSVDVRVFACSVAVAEPAAVFLERSFLTPVTGERNTVEGRHEALTLYAVTETPAAAVCRYFTDTGTVESSTVQLGTVSGRATLDVSPARFASGRGRLIGYTVRCGLRSASYRVLPYAPAADPAFIYRNCFGAWETLYCTGMKESSTSYSRSQATIDGHLCNYDIAEVQQHKVRTGPLRPGTESAVLDVARSKSVYLFNADGTPGREVTITDCDSKHTNDDSEIPDFTVTYRIADRRTVIINPIRPPRLFDTHFDEHFN